MIRRWRLEAQGACVAVPAGLQWLSSDGEKEMILTKEPDSTPWLRIKSWQVRQAEPEPPMR